MADQSGDIVHGKPVANFALSHLKRIPWSDDDDETLGRKVLADNKLTDLLRELRESRFQLAVTNLAHRMRETSYVCPLCTGINLNDMESQGGYQHYPNLQDLKTSAVKDRCKVCMMLWAAVLHRYGSGTLYDTGSDGQISLKSSGTGLGSRVFRSSIQIALPSAEHSTDLPELGLSHDRHHVSDRIAARPTALDPMSYDCLEILQKWMHTCTQDHASCSSSTKYGPLPTRIIDVGDAKHSKSQSPRLINSTEVLQPAAYVTLSHCWGGIVPLTTTKATEMDRRTGIQMRDLPQTFKDAVNLTRRLSYRYLWIDSLCIIQDDTDDWVRESARMGDIYRGSILTISAMSAGNSTEGFLGCRDPNLTAECEINLFSDGKIHDADAEPGSRQDYAIVTFPPLEPGTDHVGTRAWTFQELLLSPRVVHYTFSPLMANRQMFWECQHLSVYEDGVRYNNTEPTKRLLRPKYSTDADSEDDSIDSDNEGRITRDSVNQMSLRSQWQKIVSKYTKRSLTYATDKLPALSGIAACIGSHMTLNKAYLAGLWIDNDLIHDLLWTVSSFRPMSRPRMSDANTRAPSWSWAALDGPIRHGNCTEPHDYACEILETHVELANEGNPYGGVKSGGYIRVLGSIKSVKILDSPLGRRRPHNYRGWLYHMTSAETPPPTLDKYRIKKKHAKNIWRAIDMILSEETTTYQQRRGAESTTQESIAGWAEINDLSYQISLGQLALTFKDAFAGFSKVERSRNALLHHLDRDPSSEEKAQFLRCLQSLEQTRKWFFERNPPERHERLAIANAHVQSSLDEATAIIDLLYSYVYMHAMLQNWNEMEAAPGDSEQCSIDDEMSEGISGDERSFSSQGSSVNRELAGSPHLSDTSNISGVYGYANSDDLGRSSNGSQLHADDGIDDGDALQREVLSNDDPQSSDEDSSEGSWANSRFQIPGTFDFPSPIHENRHGQGQISFDEGPAPSHTAGSLVCLLMTTNCKWSSSSYDYLNPHGLVLAPVADFTYPKDGTLRSQLEQEKTYRRVGVFKLEYYDKGEFFQGIEPDVITII